MDFSCYKEKNKLVMDTIQLKKTKGIPTCLVNIMQHDYLDKIANAEPGSYCKNPEEVYLTAQRNLGASLMDQYLVFNPLEMGREGYDNAVLGATTGAKQIVCDGILIDSPEAVVEHLETVAFEKIRKNISEFNEEKRVREIIDYEYEIQNKLGDNLLKTGYGTIGFPNLCYTDYGYENYFMAYALYPEVIEKHFSLQADYYYLNNKAAARAYREAGLPPLYRLDHDIADSRGTLVNVKSLDQLWMPHFARALEPVLNTDVRLIWHCDGNLMEMVPRLIDVGIKGFQGFQYEDGMDYKKICGMKTREGENLIIWAGVSVTRTLPFGTPADVKNEMKYLVENGPETGLFLSASSSIAPGAPWENIEMMIEGFRYYREHGRD